MFRPLEQFLAELKAFRRDIRMLKGERVTQKAMCQAAKDLPTIWYQEHCPVVSGSGAVDEDVVSRYENRFETLLKLGNPNNLKTSYLKALDVLIRTFEGDIIIPLRKQPAASGLGNALKQILVDARSADDTAYLSEAVECAQGGYRRAAAVLGWCAAINRIHLTIEARGFQEFNAKAKWMMSQTKGRYKKFKSIDSVNSVGDLRETFDTKVLWVIEALGLIDANQHKRLLGCYSLRSQCAHPGEAPVTDYNLMSFFSDIEMIVLGNPKFLV